MNEHGLWHHTGEVKVVTETDNRRTSLLGKIVERVNSGGGGDESESA